MKIFKRNYTSSNNNRFTQCDLQDVAVAVAVAVSGTLKNKSDQENRKFYSYIIPGISAFFGAVIAPIMVIMFGHNYDYSASKRDARSIACQIHMYYYLPSHIVQKGPSGETILTFHIPDDYLVNLINPEEFSHTNQPIIADLRETKSALKSLKDLIKDKKTDESGVFVSITENDPDYNRIKVILSLVDDSASRTAKDTLSSLHIGGKPSYCDLNAEP